MMKYGAIQSISVVQYFKTFRLTGNEMCCRDSSRFSTFAASAEKLSEMFKLSNVFGNDI